MVLSALKMALGCIFVCKATRWGDKHAAMWAAAIIRHR